MLLPCVWACHYSGFIHEHYWMRITIIISLLASAIIPTEALAAVVAKAVDGCEPGEVLTLWGRLRYGRDLLTTSIDCCTSTDWHKDVAVNMTLPLDGCPTEASRATVDATRILIDKLCSGDELDAMFGALDIFKRADGSPLRIYVDDIMNAVTVGADGSLSVADTFHDNIYTPAGWRRRVLHVVWREPSPEGALMFDLSGQALGVKAKPEIIPGKYYEESERRLRRSVGDDSTGSGGLLLGTPLGFFFRNSPVHVELITDPHKIEKLMDHFVYNPHHPELYSSYSFHKLPTIDSVLCAIGFVNSRWGEVEQIWRVPVPRRAAESYFGGVLLCKRGGGDIFYPLMKPFAVPLDACPHEASRESLVATRALMDQICEEDEQVARLAGLDIERHPDGSPFVLDGRDLWKSIVVAAETGALMILTDRSRFPPIEFAGHYDFRMRHRFVVWRQRTPDGSVIFDPIYLAPGRTAVPFPVGPVRKDGDSGNRRAISDPKEYLTLDAFPEGNHTRSSLFPRIASFVRTQSANHTSERRSTSL